MASPKQKEFALEALRTAIVALHIERKALTVKIDELEFDHLDDDDTRQSELYQQAKGIELAIKVIAQGLHAKEAKAHRKATRHLDAGWSINVAVSS